jgi:hypothetical protein
MEKRIALFLIASLMIALLAAGCSEKVGEAFSKPFQKFNQKQQQYTAQLAAQQAMAQQQAGAGITAAGQQEVGMQKQPGTVGIATAGQQQVSGMPGSTVPGSLVAGTLPSAAAITPSDCTIDSTTTTCDGNVLVTVTKRTCSTATRLQCTEVCKNNACACSPSVNVYCKGNIIVTEKKGEDCNVNVYQEVCPSGQLCQNNVCVCPTTTECSTIANQAGVVTVTRSGANCAAVSRSAPVPCPAGQGCEPTTGTCVSRMV